MAPQPGGDERDGRVGHLDDGAAADGAAGAAERPVVPHAREDGDVVAVDGLTPAAETARTSASPLAGAGALSVPACAASSRLPRTLLLLVHRTEVKSWDLS